MPLSPGTRLGPYEITDALGAGGMGEVYKARDTRLDRVVAIKVLPSHLEDNQELRERFDREARTISSLNHPYICALYDVGHDNGMDYLVMEYLEGETLAERLARERVPTAEVVTLGTQIAEALDKAHRSGVTHRDLKPGNIMLTKNGVKLLDFGLAKMAAPPVDPVTSSLTSMPTEQQASQPLTERGTILGTFQYMAPEQLEGNEADARSDIFALGAVLYEMATGKRAFEGKSQASLIAAILEREPSPISAVEPMSPPALDLLAKACMAKDPEERVQTAHDVNLQLKWIREGGSAVGIPAPVAASRKRASRIAWLAAIFFAMVAAALVLVLVTRPTDERRTISATILPPPAASFTIYGTHMMALSPDGTRLAFVVEDGGERLLWVRPLGSDSAQPLRGTSGALFPFWSPDSRFVGFFAEGKLKKIDVNGGAAITVCNAPDGRGGTWSQDGVIVFAPGRTTGLMRVPAAGGEAVVVVERDSTRQESTLRFPSFLPGGKSFAFVAGSPDDAVWVASLDGQRRRKILSVDSHVEFANGHVLFVREHVLMAQPIDFKTLEFSGDGFSIADNVQLTPSWNRGGFTVSQTGMLMYVEEGESAGSVLAWYDREGKPLNRIETDGRIDDIAISRDNRFLAMAKPDDQGGWDVWTYDLGRDLISRATFGEECDDPVFSPDGTRIAFSMSGEICERRTSGAGERRLLYESNEDKIPCDWTPDGRYILFMQSGDNNAEDLFALPVTIDALSVTASEPVALLKSPYREITARISPDGRWLTYASDESGAMHVYVQDFPGQTNKWQISREPGTMPQWGGDGRELYYVGLDQRMVVTAIDGTGESLVVGDTKTLFSTRIEGSLLARTHQYVVTSDGQRFGMVEELDATDIRTAVAHLVLDWLPQDVR